MEKALAHMAGHGLNPGELIQSGKIERFSIGGKKSKDCWYIANVYNNAVYVSYGNWSTGLSEKYSDYGENKTAKEIAEIKIEFNKLQKEIESLKIKEYEKASKKAITIWSKAKDGEHPYLEKKQIKNYGAKIYKGSLVIPVYKDKKIVSLQFINLDGKRFLSGGEKSGGAYVIKGSTECIIICEGFSTGASIHEATGYQIYIAFDAGNLLKVSKRIRAMFPDLKVIIACDNDKYKEKNIGVEAGTVAASAIKAELVIPKFKDEGLKPSDFNDLHTLEGLIVVEAQINKGDKNLKILIEGWLSKSPGEFSIRDIDYDLNIQTLEQKKTRLDVLELLVLNNKLERVGSRRGYYRPYHMDLEPIDYTDASTSVEFVKFWLPFKLHDYVGILPGNIIIIAGAPNAGKTALVMNILKNNRNNFKDIHYFNSEVDKEELKLRLGKFDIGLNDWGMKAWVRASDFSDVIRPGRGNLNVIDFLEVHDEFYKVGQYIKDIHSKLDGAIAVIALQKNAGQDNGLGGFRSMEKARLTISMDNGKMKVTKAKNFITQVNPNGFIAEFSLSNGCRFLPAGKSKSGDVWYKEI